MIKHIKFLLILFFLICVKNHSQENMNIDFITGIEHNDLVGDSLKLESKTFFAFKKMEDAAKKDGIILKIVSAHRSFERQNFIWNKKYNKFTDEYSLNPMDAINEIIRFSTIPGTSRHHWGTDIDIIDGKYPDENNVLMSEKYEKGGIFYDLKKWLSNNSEKFGFFLTYNNDPKRKGFEYEPWHYSYKPSSKKYLKLLLSSDLEKLFKNKNLNGYQYFDKKFIDKYISEFIMDINPDLK
jgi:LAS superfamily LD-carboxypeptidase LdcB